MGKKQTQKFWCAHKPHPNHTLLTFPQIALGESTETVQKIMVFVFPSSSYMCIYPLRELLEGLVPQSGQHDEATKGTVDVVEGRLHDSHQRLHERLDLVGVVVFKRMLGRIINTRRGCDFLIYSNKNAKANQCK